MKYRTAVAALLGATWVLAGCVTANPPPPLPAPMTESIPKPPVSAVPLIWQPGHWDWTGSGYGWIPGQYKSRRRTMATTGCQGSGRTPARAGPGIRHTGYSDSRPPLPQLNRSHPDPARPCGKVAAVLVPGPLLQGLIPGAD